jgi:predicted cupin superfamily sugar epimerase
MGSMPARSDRVRELIETLSLQPHPERGHYVETHRAPERVSSPSHTGERAASTAIYFLIDAEQPITFLHRLASDEVFHLYEGGPLEVLRLLPDGSSDVARLGLDLARGERPMLVLSRGTWFGTELAPGATHCLIGCTVAPGFELEDFELADAAELYERYPEQRERIARMRRPGERVHRDRG